MTASPVRARTLGQADIDLWLRVPRCLNCLNCSLDGLIVAISAGGHCTAASTAGHGKCAPPPLSRYRDIVTLIFLHFLCKAKQKLMLSYVNYLFNHLLTETCGEVDTGWADWHCCVCLVSPVGVPGVQCHHVTMGLSNRCRSFTSLLSGLCIFNRIIPASLRGDGGRYLCIYANIFKQHSMN